MTDNEIIKALACCYGSEEVEDCDCCPYRQVANGCNQMLGENAFDLVNRQKAEISKLKGQVNRLKQYDEERDIRLHARLSATAKAEGIKEFAEKLKEAPIKMCIPLLGLQTKSEIEEYFNGILLKLRDAIDDLVKEMTEGEK